MTAPDAKPTPQAQITIFLMSDGAVVVNGPLANKVVSYGMLEAARDAIANHQPTPSPAILPVTRLAPMRSLPNGHA